MAHLKRDLLIHYDEERGELIFHSVPTDAAAGLRASSFDGVRLEVPASQAVTPDAAEQELGRMAFALIDLNSAKKIGIRDYKAQADAAHIEYVAQLKNDAGAGDIEATYHLALEMHRSAMSGYSLPDLAHAEELLMSAVAAGHAQAKETAESWPMLKAAAERRIARGKPV